jgi:GNAT superfamily N-acetyltransferase
MRFERSRGEHRITTDKQELELDAVHAYLTRSYWAEGISKQRVAKGIEHALCFSLKIGARQVGFARVISDYATFAYLCDVYVLEEQQGQGLGTWLMETVMSHPDLLNLRRFMLVTQDAHGLYEKVGFRPLAHPPRHMEIARPGLYKTLEGEP